MPVAPLNAFRFVSDRKKHNIHGTYLNLILTCHTDHNNFNGFSFFAYDMCGAVAMFHVQSIISLSERFFLPQIYSFTESMEWQVRESHFKYSTRCV